MENKKYELIKEPLIRKSNNKFYNSNNIMIDFIISLTPIILIGWYQNGIKIFINNKSIASLLYPLIFIFLGSLFTFLSEAVYYFITDKNDRNINCIKKSLLSHSIIPGLLLSIILPLNTPIWILLLGCIFASIIGKMVYGGFGHNIFNPALVGYIFLMTAFYGVINNSHIDTLSSATPLQDLNSVLFHNMTIEEVIKNNGGIINICFGLKTGTIGETSSIACIISFIYLAIKKIIDIKTPIIILFTFFITSFIVGIFIDIDPLLLSLFNLFNGGIIFGSIFMATEPITSPRSYYGKIIYAFFIGLIALILRLLSDLRDGTSTAILFMNSLSIIIDLFGAKLRVQKNTINKMLKLFMIVISCLFINAYVIKLKSYKVNIDNNTEYTVEIISIKQNYEKLKDNLILFNYEILVNENTYIVECDINGNILSDLENIDTQYREVIAEQIQKNKINKRSLNMEKHYGYINEIEQIDENTFVITSLSRGYFSDVSITITIKDNIIIETTVDLSKETELNGGLEHSNGSKQELIQIGKGERSDIVSGVTYTSVSLFSARKAIIDYISYIMGGSTNE